MNQIRHYREALGLSREQLAKAVGKVKSAIGHYETEIRTPDLETSRAIVAALNDAGADCSLDDVFPPVSENAA